MRDASDVPKLHENMSASITDGIYDPSPCRLALKCGTAKIEDTRVVTEGRHATFTFKVKNTVTTPRFDGCPASPMISEDGSFQAKASLDDTGKWALDGAPTRK